jgi:transposase
MIVGRIVFQGSKLGLCNRWEDTCLWELCATEGRPDVDECCYLPLDRLLKRQKAIQKKLAQKHLHDGCLVLYDITSSYFEGSYLESEIVQFGYNRDGKKGHEQIVIGLLCTKDGCPIGCEVFSGNTNDSSTVLNKVTELREQYELEKLVFVGDRGMVTQARLKELRDINGLNTISALTHRQIVQLLERKVIQAELFDEHKIIEVHDPQSPAQRYFLCRNPLSREKETKTRKRLLDLTVQGLTQLADYKQRVTVETLGSRVGKLLAKYKMGKFIDWHIDAYSAYYVQWHMHRRLEPLYSGDKKGKNRRWTFENVIEQLRQITSNTFEFEQITQPTDTQKQIAYSCHVATPLKS